LNEPIPSLFIFNTRKFGKAKSQTGRGGINKVEDNEGNAVRKVRVGHSNSFIPSLLGFYPDKGGAGSQRPEVKRRGDTKTESRKKSVGGGRRMRRGGGS